jgi:hypothetical protein
VTVAEDGPADGAVEAVTALRPEREDHMVAGFHCGDAGTDVLDDAGRLVAEHHRQRKRPVPVARASNCRSLGYVSRWLDEQHVVDEFDRAQTVPERART